MAFGQTYSIANITSVKPGMVMPDRLGANAMIVCGCLCVMLALILDMLQHVSSCLLLLGLGVALLYGGKMALSHLMPRYYVIINTASQDLRTLSSTDRGEITAVIGALSAAMIARG